MQCPRCYTANLDTSRFCVSCAGRGGMGVVYKARDIRRFLGVVLGSVILFTLFGCASRGGGSTVGSERLFSIMPQEAEASSPLRELFTSERPLVFTLEADFDQLTRDRAEKNEERPARAFLPGLAGDTLELPLKVRTRGNFRLRRDICPFPPCGSTSRPTPWRGRCWRARTS